MLDSLSDTFINTFSKVRKPDARFVEMAEELERYEEGLAGVERLVGRGKTRVDGEYIDLHFQTKMMKRLVDLAQDYLDMAAAYQGLGYLESGITEPLNRFAEKMLDFSALLKYMVSRETNGIAYLANGLRIEHHHRRPFSQPITFTPGLHQRSSPSHQTARSETTRFRRTLCLSLCSSI